jgi:hypothetical protein
MGEKMSAYRALIGKTEGKRPLGRHTYRWEENNELEFGELGWGVWIGFTWLRIETSGWLL